MEIYLERVDMTVCIAAICEENKDDPKVILCTDRKIGGALGSAETMLKTRTIATGWKCLTSGSDTDILATLRLLKNQMAKARTVDETNVLPIVRSALNERKRDKADELVHGKFAISYSDFLEIGKARFPDDIFRATISEVEQISLDAEFIIAGYANTFPILVKTDTRCGAVIKEEFAVAGEGGYLAQASLLNRAHQNISTFERALYTVVEAKKFAQGAPSVGVQTSLSVMHRNGKIDVMVGPGLKYFDSKYSELGPKQIPDNLEISADMFHELK